MQTWPSLLMSSSFIRSYVSNTSCPKYRPDFWLMKAVKSTGLLQISPVQLYSTHLDGVHVRHVQPALLRVQMLQGWSSAQPGLQPFVQRVSRHLDFRHMSGTRSLTASSFSRNPRSRPECAVFFHLWLREDRLFLKRIRATNDTKLTPVKKSSCALRLGKDRLNSAVDRRQLSDVHELIEGLLMSISSLRPVLELKMAMRRLPYLQMSSVSVTSRHLMDAVQRLLQAQSELISCKAVPLLGSRSNFLISRIHLFTPPAARS